MPSDFGHGFRICAGALAGILAFTAVAPAAFPRLIAAAQAQAPGPAQEQIDFEAALEGYGHWVQHPSLGDVWVPDNVPQDWQPYRIGKWVYTDEWGWYWDSDEDFGWVTYHYGRWYFDREIGWAWIPDDEWGPAWVNWRQGDDYVGWAPTPPDEFVDNDEDPDAYMFVNAGDLLAPDVYTVFIPYGERRDFYRRSSLVNRTIYFADRRGAVNPGIPPDFIARASGRPFHSSSIAPIVLAGTIGVAGAVILRNGFRDRSRTRIHVRESDRIIQPGNQFQRLPGLNKGERGRLGSNAPRGAQGGNPVLQLNTQGKTQGSRKFAPKTGASQFESKKFEGKKIEPKQLEQNDPQRKNLQRPSDLNRSKQFDAGKKSFEPKNFPQRNFEQKNIQQNNQPQFQKKAGSQPSGMQQNNSQRNFQQNNTPRQNIQRQNIPQHTTQPKVQNTPRPQIQRGNNNQDKKN